MARGARLRRTAEPAAAFRRPSSPLTARSCGADVDEVWVLETIDLDDVPGEVIGYCSSCCSPPAALDVFAAPISMKKNRPGVLLSVLAAEANVPALEEILFRELLTFGIRRYPVQRDKLHRRAHTVTTSCGPVRGKLGWLDGGKAIFTPEYEDCARLARSAVCRSRRSRTPRWMPGDRRKIDENP